MSTPKTFTILIADDDRDDQQMMQKALSECKAELNIVPVYDGIRVIDYLYRRHAYKNAVHMPDLLLLDLNMPLMDGFQVLREIRGNVSFKSLPIYVITTSRSAEHSGRALEMGASGFYNKGSRSKDLLKIMHEVCRECFETEDTDKRL